MMRFAGGFQADELLENDGLCAQDNGLQTESAPGMLTARSCHHLARL